MGSPRSLFQTLPLLIVRKVVEYLEGRSRTSFNLDIDAHNEAKAVLTPLLLVSERWRTVALESICDNCRLHFNPSSRKVEVRIPPWPVRSSCPRLHKSHLVKRVVVPLYLWKGMCYGTFGWALSMMRHENISFPTANTLVLLLSKAANDQTGMAPPISKEDVANFVRSLLQLTPAASSVSLGLFALSDTEPNYEQLYDALVSELHRGKITCLDVRNKLDDPATGSVSDFPLSLSLRGVSGLTSISHGPDIPCAPFSRLAYLNASTLKTLNIKIAEEKNWTDLINGGSEVSAVYSSLESLSLDIVNVPYTTTWATIEGAEPFPKLSTLDLRGGYPFDDDLFFRGNGGTLQNLRIPLSAIARNILGRFSVLKRSGVTRMNQIHIGEVSIADRAFVDGSADLPIEQQVQRMVEVTAMLGQCEDTTEFRIFNAVYCAPNTATLQHLELHKLKSPTNCLIGIVSAIPSLVSCSCELVRLGQSIEDIPVGERPSRLRKKYYPLSRNFRKWRVLGQSNGDEKLDIIAQSAMLLAVLCPSFVHVDLPLEQRNSFGCRIAWASFNHPFEPYTDLLRRIVYKEV